MGLVGGIVGAIVGFAVGIVFAEIVFANNASWPDVIPFALAAAGALAGHQAGRSFAARRAKARPSL